VFEGVLAAQRAVLKAMGPGVSWVDMHLLAEREVLRALLSLGVLRDALSDQQERENAVSDQIEKENALLDHMASLGLGAVFLPCG